MTQPCGPAQRWRSRRSISQPVQAAFKSRTASKATASDQIYLCIDCGWIYDGRQPFADLPKDYNCPVCQAPKRR